MIPEEATDLIIYNQIVKDVSITSVIKFSTDIFSHAITIEHCKINSFIESNIQFNKPVKFISCQFNKCDFSFAYFAGGLEIVNCSFKNYLNFECGGHNKSKSEFRMEGSIFYCFVNFYDCFYEGPFILKDNELRKGTNILGNIGMPYETTFIHKPVFENNKGILNLNTGSLNN